MNALADRTELGELFARYADMADLNRFGELGPLVLTDPLTFDYESMIALPPTTMPLNEVLDILGRSVAPFAATYHGITGHVIDIDGDKARMHAHVRTELWLPEELAAGGPHRWLVVGFYDNEAVRTPDGWRINHLKFTLTYQENAHLSTVAQSALETNTRTTAAKV
jgi:hypothetical protein